MESPHGPREGCPDPETLAAYVDGRLDAGARETVAAHLSTCEGCYDVFAETVRFQKESRGSSIAPGKGAAPLWFRRPRIVVGIGASLLAAGLAGVAVLRGGLGLHNTRSAAFRELVRAVGTSRPIEPRLTGGFVWGEPRPVVRGSTAAEPSWQVLAAAAKLKSKAEGATSSDAARELAVAELIVGKTDDAIVRLEDVARKEPKNAKVLSDLSAAWLMKAARGAQPEKAAKALEAAEAALAVDALSREARFNRGLALEALGDAGHAEKAWLSYLEIDAESDWAREARRHLEALRLSHATSSRETVRRRLAALESSSGDMNVHEDVAEFPDIARDVVMHDLLPTWASMTLAATSPDVKRHLLRHTRALADAYLAATGDRLPLQAVEEIRRGGMRIGREPELARAILSLRDGEDLFDDERLEAAAERVTRAKVVFDQNAGVLALAADYQLARTAYDRGRLDDAADRLHRLADKIGPREFPFLRARIHRVEALISADKGDLADALAHFTAALDAYDRMGDRAESAATHARLASNLSIVGDAPAAWGHLAPALRGLERVTQREHQTILNHAALTSERQGLWRVALAYQRFVLEDQAHYADPRAAAWAALRSASAHAQLGDLALAEKSFAEARAMEAPIRDGSFGARFDADAGEAEAEAFSSEAPEVAIGAATKAMEYFSSVEPERLPALLLSRGRAYRAKGLLELSESDFARGIEEIERRRGGAGGFRISYFDQAWQVFDEMIRLQAVDRRNPKRALDVAERYRARDLLDRTGLVESAKPHPLDSGAIQSRLPDGGFALLYFVCLSDRFLTWAVTRREIAFFEQALPAESLSRTCRRLVEGLERNQPWGELESTSAALYDVLVRPSEGRFGADSVVMIAPDATLARLPFAALYDRKRREFFVERHPIGVVPSATVLLRGGLAPRGPVLRALVVGSPDVEEGRGLSLPPLRGAREEARAVASLYPKATLVLGSEATRSRFLGSIGGNDVVHFAGHAEVDRDHPGRSRLFLSAEGGTPGTVQAREMESLSLAGTRVFVLAGCSTAVGLTFRGEGVLDLSRPLLASGVETVVGTLWDIEDESAQRLFIAFHEGLLEGTTPAEALRRSQLSLLASPDERLRSPAAWAGVQVVGSL